MLVSGIAANATRPCMIRHPALHCRVARIITHPRMIDTIPTPNPLDADPPHPVSPCPIPSPKTTNRVVYLNPGDGMKASPQRDLEEPDIPAGGSSLANPSPWRPLCSVDRRFSAGGVGIAACLPDRLCLVVRGGAGGGIAHLVTRCGVMCMVWYV